MGCDLYTVFETWGGRAQQRRRVSLVLCVILATEHAIHAQYTMITQSRAATTRCNTLWTTPISQLHDVFMRALLHMKFLPACSPPALCAACCADAVCCGFNSVGSTAHLIHGRGETEEDNYDELPADPALDRLAGVRKTDPVAEVSHSSRTSTSARVGFVPHIRLTTKRSATHAR